MDRTTQGPPDCQDAPWAHSLRPRPAKCEACVQHDKRDEQRSVLNRHRQNHYSPKPYKTPPGLTLSITLGYSP
jgi:hypothetical protein